MDRTKPTAEFGTASTASPFTESERKFADLGVQEGLMYFVKASEGVKIYTADGEEKVIMDSLDTAYSECFMRGLTLVMRH